jgi:hypothetical protein
MRSSRPASPEDGSTTRRRRAEPAQIVAGLLEPDGLISPRRTVDRAVEQIGATVHAYYRRPKAFGGQDPDRMTRRRAREGLWPCRPSQWRAPAVRGSPSTQLYIFSVI